MTNTGGLPKLLAIASAVALAASLVVAGETASANGPPTPPPYQKIFVRGLEPGPGYLQCWDADGTAIYDRAWALKPLVRGPLFAPVALWLADASNQPVAPLEFTSFADVGWRTIDADPAEGGNLSEVSPAGRPVGFGIPQTDTSPQVTYTSMNPQGYVDFGAYVITNGLAQMLGLPSRLVGRTLKFDNEGTIAFTVPRTLFPLTAKHDAVTLPTTDAEQYETVGLGDTTITCTGSATYNGSAHTLAPLVRGHQWGPIAFWLAGDRIVTPQYFTTRSQGTWSTVSAAPARQGKYQATHPGAPSATAPGPTTPPTESCALGTGPRTQPSP